MSKTPNRNKSLYEALYHEHYLRERQSGRQPSQLILGGALRIQLENEILEKPQYTIEGREYAMNNTFMGKPIITPVSHTLSIAEWIK